MTDETPPHAFTDLRDRLKDWVADFEQTARTEDVDRNSSVGIAFLVYHLIGRVDEIGRAPPHTETTQNRPTIPPQYRGGHRRNEGKRG